MPDMRPELAEAAPALGRRQKWLLGLLCLVGLVDGFDLQSIGFLAPLMAKSWHIDVALFGAVFSAGLLGLGIGSVVMSHAADSWGRQRTAAGLMAYIGTLSLLTAGCANRPELIALRFVTCLGLGGAVPVTVALASDHTPARLRATVVCLLAACMPAGGLLASLVGHAILPMWGWPSMFVVGGVAPLGLAVALMAHQGTAAPPGAVVAALEPPAPLAQLWTDRAWHVTLPLWLAFFCNLLVLYFIVNWVPALLIAAKFAPNVGIAAIGYFSFGGILGTLAQGPVMSRFGVVRVVVLELVAVIGLIIGLGTLTLTVPLIAVLTFLTGWSLQGAQGGLSSFAALHYPQNIRARALGWGFGCGRLGAVVGALLGGQAMAAHLAPNHILLATSLPVLVDLLAFWLATLRRGAGGVA